MQPENRDLAYLWDMREAARDVVEFVHGLAMPISVRINGFAMQWKDGLK